MRFLATIPLLLALLYGVSVCHAQSRPHFESKWGGSGSALGDLDAPIDVAVGADDKLYVLERRNQRIQVFNDDGTPLTQWLIHGDEITLDRQGRLYVVDGSKSRVDIYELAGTAMPARVARWERPGSGDGEFMVPEGVAVDAEGNVFVSDWALNRIQKLDAEGNFIHKWGQWGYGDGDLVRPRGLAIDAQGFLYVAESDGDRVSKFDGDGNFVTDWGSLGPGPGEFEHPEDIAIGPDGLVYIADVAYNRIQVFQPDGTFVALFGSRCNFNFPTQGCVDPDGDGPLELGDGQFSAPCAVAVNATGDIFVADANNDRIQKFRWGPTRVRSVAWGALKARYR